MTSTVGTLAWLVLLAPLFGAISIGLLFKQLSGRAAGALATTVLFTSFALSVATLVALQSEPEESRQVTANLWDYAVTAGLDVKLSLLVDPLSVIMMLVVTGVSSLIHLYATAYMVSDEGYNRFFSYLNLFVFSMLVLVLGGNLVLLIVGWGLVGMASYLLISFWYRRKTATKAGIKAFLINVFGDVGIVLGSFLLLRHAGTVDYLELFAKAEGAFAAHPHDLTWGLVLILLGAFAKSAQFPLHTWLPDAMEGPTPVSALIHAATMVTAGVYLIARLHPLFELSDVAATVGVVIGTITLVMAATMAIVQTDLKRIIAYSTMSQIGYMVVAVSAGAYTAGIFHLMTHAFFKALLFMAAGSVIGAMGGVQDIDRMGGLRKALPFTFACFMIGSLALAGLPPFSGFFSKDEILGGLLERGDWYTIIAAIGYLAALLTACYSFRAIYKVFYGDLNEETQQIADGHHLHFAPANPSTGEAEDYEVGFPGKEHHTAEENLPMKVAMGTLAFLAVVAGLLQIPHVTHVVGDFLHPTFHASELLEQTEASTSTALLGMGLGTLAALLGIGIATQLWLKKPGSTAGIQAKLQSLHTLLSNKYYVDEAIDLIIVRPFRWAGAVFERHTERLVTQTAVVGGSSGVVRIASALVRAAQTGSVRIYAAVVSSSTAAILLYALVVR
ncbi:MAG: NADH-quinone oxidoreductase subunit L [Solirubrobacteraceae bacterium]|nr:NADH-quinone oxidoreductase subunit L [Solirubrobacteraceae bacterium]